MFEHVRRLARGTIIYGVGGALSRAVQLILLPFFTSRLSPAEFGLVAMLALVSLLLVPLLTLGLGGGASATYFRGDEPTRRSGTIWSAFLMIAIATLVLGTVVIAAAPQISLWLFDDARYAGLIRVTLASAACTALAAPFLLYLQFEERAGRYVAINVAGAFVTAAVSAYLVGAHGLGADALVWGMLAGQGISLAGAAFLVAPQLPARFSKALVRELGRVGPPLIPSFAAVFILSHGNKYLLQELAGLDAAGVYYIGFNFGLLMSLVVNGFTSAWFPFAMSFSGRRADAPRVFARMSTYYVLGVGALTVCFFVFARPVTMVMTQPAYEAAFLIIGLSAAAQFLSGAAALLLPPIYFADEVHSVVLVQFPAAAIAMLINFLVIPVAGIFGAGLALAGGYLILVAMQYAWNRYRGYLAIPFERGRITAAGLVFSAIAAAFLLPRNFSLSVEISLSLIGVIVLTAAVFALLTPSERASARMRVGRSARSKPLSPVT